MDNKNFIKDNQILHQPDAEIYDSIFNIEKPNMHNKEEYVKRFKIAPIIKKSSTKYLKGTVKK